ncbi:hypothetical protein MUP59_01710 [Candidatus Bathyarchaeota archaeon]|nr:hypothetical protein [Candidatus Bathyarchaeota archaeon]
MITSKKAGYILDPQRVSGDSSLGVVVIIYGAHNYVSPPLRCGCKGRGFDGLVLSEVPCDIR